MGQFHLVQFRNAATAMRNLGIGDKVVVDHGGQQVEGRVEGTALQMERWWRSGPRKRMILMVRVTGIPIPVKHDQVSKQVMS
jgi:hypothetical protein